MNKSLHQAVLQWIESENGSRSEEADAALATVFEGLPLAAPSPRFAERVMARAGLTQTRSTRWAWSWRAPLAASLLLAGLAAAILPSILMKLVDPLSGIHLLEWAAALFLGTVHRLSDGLSIWSGMVEAGYGMRLAFSTTPMILAVVAALVLSTSALGALYGLLRADRRRSDYVY